MVKGSCDDISSGAGSSRSDWLGRKTLIPNNSQEARTNLASRLGIWLLQKLSTRAHRTDLLCYAMCSRHPPRPIDMPKSRAKMTIAKARIRVADVQPHCPRCPCGHRTRHLFHHTNHSLNSHHVAISRGASPRDISSSEPGSAASSGLQSTATGATTAAPLWLPVHDLRCPRSGSQPLGLA